jgi:hypothetical protein
MALYQVNAGDRILAADLNQFYAILKGVAASGEAVSLIYNAAGVLIFQPSSDPVAGTELAQVKNNAGTVQSALSSDGKVYAAVGTLALPGYAFESEKSTGMYRAATGDVVMSVLGAKAAEFTNAASVAILQVGDGNTSILRLAVAGDTSAGQIRIGTAGDVGGFWIGQAIASAAHQFEIWDQTAGVDRLIISSTGAVTIGGASLTLGGTSGGKLIAAGTLTAGGLLGSAVQIATSGPLIYSGSGAPSISATVKGSLYLRTDGTTTNDRIYVAKDAAGTWASLTAAS